ncbi:MAG: AI-2E family transporter [Ignavibacteria bacterium]|nr:AI-2E family transporter [Ignavibacteria bacterium]
MTARRSSQRGRRRGSRPGPDIRGANWDTLFQSLGRIEVVLLVGAILLLLVLIYSIQSIVSPFLVLGAILFLLYPLRGYSLAKKIMWLSAILFGIWFAVSISSILAPFVVSMVMAYVMNPIVESFERWSVPRWVTSLILILILIGVITLLFFFLLPVILTQFEGILDSLSKLIADFNSWVWNSSLVKALERYGISADEVRSTFTSQVMPKLDDILKNLLQGLLVLAGSISSLVTQIFYVVLVPFLTFYMLADLPKIHRRFLLLFPQRLRDRVERYLESADEIIGRYLRGAILVAFMQGILVAVLFSVVGIKYALMLGAVAAVLDLVPYFGLIVTMVIAAIVATFSDPPVLPKVLFALGSIEALRIFETMYLSPKIVGGRVGLHPLIVIFSILVFFYFLGFVGLLVAVPVTALIILLVREWEADKRGIALEDYHSAKPQ